MKLRLVSKSFSEQLKKHPPKKKAYGNRRKHLNAKEVDRLEAAAKTRGRYGERDSLMIRMAYRHALRASELVALTWEQVNLESRELYVRRRKNSKNSTHGLIDREVKALRKMKKHSDGSPYVFQGERTGKMSERGFFRIVQQAGDACNLTAELKHPVNPHMLRHAAGYELINKDGKDEVDLRTIQDYMGHKNIQNTVIYTELSIKKLKRINHLL